MTGRFTENPAYQQYEKLLVQLHGLIAEGKCDSDEADQVRDEMDAPWKKLNADERSRLDALSGDLYMLQGDEVLKTPAAADSKEELYQQIQQCKLRGDWAAVLELLRRRPKSIPDGPVAHTRSRAYNALGQTEIGLLFFEYSMKFKPHDPNIKAMHLMLLRDSGHVREAMEAARRFIQDLNASPSLLIVAADVYFSFTKDYETSGVKHILDILAAALSRVSPQWPTPVRDIGFAYLLAAYCLQLLGLHDESLTALDEAISLEPDDPDLRALREAVGDNESQHTNTQTAFNRAMQSRRVHDFETSGDTATTAHLVWGRAA